MLGSHAKHDVQSAEQSNYAEANIVCQAGNLKAPVPTGEKVFIVPEDHVVEKERVTQWVEHTPVEREFKTTVAPTGVVTNLGVHVERGPAAERVVGEHTCFPTNTETISGVAGITTSDRKDSLNGLGNKLETAGLVDKHHDQHHVPAVAAAAPLAAGALAADKDHHTHTPVATAATTTTAPAVAAAAPVAAAFVSSGVLGDTHNKKGKDFVAGSVPEYGATLTPGDGRHVPGTAAYGAANTAYDAAGSNHGLTGTHIPAGAQPGVGVIQGSHIDKKAPKDIQQGTNANLDLIQNSAADSIGPVPGYAAKAVNFVSNLLPGKGKHDVTDGKLNGGALAVAEHGADGTLGANTTTVTQGDRHVGLLGNDNKGHSPLKDAKKQ